MLAIAIGIILLGATTVLARWGMPREGRPSPVPNKWGMGAGFPMLIMSMGIFGLILVLKGVFPD